MVVEVPASLSSYPEHRQKNVLTNEQRAPMNAKIFALSPEVREAALDLKAVRRMIKESGDRGYEWLPAEASARRRMVTLS